MNIVQMLTEVSFHKNHRLLLYNCAYVLDRCTSNTVEANTSLIGLGENILQHDNAHKAVD